MPISEINDTNPEETQEWLDALEAVLDEGGVERANVLLQRLSARMATTGARLPYTITTPYRNTIPAHKEAFMPGDLFVERRIRAMIRWNALAMVTRANQREGELGGHISSFASSATLYDVGFNYFFRGPDDKSPGDLIYFQGHSSPGVYARSFLEGRLTEADLDNFRREVDGDGLSSYPHPWLMPDYWQFPTVSMGFCSITSIYQARFMKYLQDRSLAKTDNRKVWAFMGDGEMDEPESLGAISLAGREKLDNLVFVVNCNLQRLDGPVRGNSKIIQELEAVFRGAGWNVIKVVWGSYWDPLLAKDKDGKLKQLMMETVDGEYQNFKARGGAYTREKFFGKLWMIRAGLFDDVDVVMDWHPSAETKANVQSSLALVDFMVEFYGQAAHASGDPWNGRSAGDALELYTDGINMYREHIKPTVRIHYHIQDAGKVVNVVPDYSRIWVRVRDTKRAGMEVVYNHVQKMAEGAAIMANVDHKVNLISGIHEVLVNRTGGAALQKNLEFLGDIKYTEAEQDFGKKIQAATEKPQVGMSSKIEPLEETLEHPMGGSTDVGDVSFVVPTIRLSATTAPKDTPWHSWAVVACGGMSIGHKGMAYAAKALSMTMVDLFENPTLVEEVKKEYKERLGDYEYKALIPDGPPPLNTGY